MLSDLKNLKINNKLSIFFYTLLNFEILIFKKF